MIDLDIDEDCQPDSQQDENFNGDLESQSFSDEWIGSNDTSRRDSSLLSIDSQQSNSSRNSFKKLPRLNRVFMKTSLRNTTCLICNSDLKTIQYCRLMAHVRKCPKMDAKQREELTEGYERHLGRKIISSESRDNNLNKKWAQFMIENNVALRCVDSRSFKAFFREAANDWKTASRKTYSTEYIPALSRIIRDNSISTVNQIGENCVTVEFDHWKDANGRALLGIVMTFQNGTRYLHSLDDVSLYGHSSDITLPYLKKAIDIMPLRAINSIVSDSAADCKLARKKLVALPEYRKVIQHRCVAHLLNNMGNNFGEDEHIKDALEWAAKISGFVTKSTRLSAILRSLSCRKPKKMCSVRWYSTVNMAESLLDAKEPILNSCSEHQDAAKLTWMRNEFNWLTLQGAVNILRPLANCIADAERQTGSLGESISSLLKYAKELMTGDWSDLLTLGAICAFLRYFGPDRLGQDEFGLMLAAYALDRRNKCDYITEEGLDLVFTTLTTLGTKCGATINYNLILQQEFAAYSTLKGEYSKDQPEDQSAIEWWDNISVGTSLKYLAGRIARLRSSSANIERTFSNLKWFQGSRRVNLSIDTLMHLTRIKMFDEQVDIRQTRTQTGSNQDLESQQAASDSEEVSEEVLELIGQESQAMNPMSVCEGPAPELLSEEDRKLYRTFAKYIDFSIVNVATPVIEEQPIELSEEEREKLIRQCRELRRKEREQLENARARTVNSDS